MQISSQRFVTKGSETHFCFHCSQSLYPLNILERKCLIWDDCNGSYECLCNFLSRSCCFCIFFGEASFSVVGVYNERKVWCGRQSKLEMSCTASAYSCFFLRPGSMSVSPVCSVHFRWTHLMSENLSSPRQSKWKVPSFTLKESTCRIIGISNFFFVCNAKPHSRSQPISWPPRPRGE